jgi:GDP/UDP-N,N'-diacetylbacillosamine 2-epimerase (hydrolysing)
MKKKIFLISSSRADYDHLFWLYKELTKAKVFRVFFLFVKIINKKKKITKFLKLEKDQIKNKLYLNVEINGDKSENVSHIIGLLIIRFTKKFSKLKPDLVIVLGDRFEILSASIAASILQIPIAHLNGGEVTHGAYDDWIRHSISKMANLHFVANKIYAKRLIQLGENNKSIFQVGGLSMENILKTKVLKKKEIEKELKINFLKKNLLVTYHPETLEKKTVIHFKKLLIVLSQLKDTMIIFTSPNIDTYNQSLIKLIRDFLKKNKNSRLYLSLGRKRYFSIVKCCDMVIGNSSSGYLEIPYLKKITINVGERQIGRLCEKSIINVKPTKYEIIKGIKKGYKILPKTKNFKLDFFYGRGNTAKKISKILKNHTFNFNFKKKFVDLC